MTATRMSNRLVTQAEQSRIEDDFPICLPSPNGRGTERLRTDCSENRSRFAKEKSIKIKLSSVYLNLQMRQWRRSLSPNKDGQYALS